MGPTVVNDVAFIGLDAYLRDGAAMGILFQANNSALLSRNLNGQRQDAKNKRPDATEETLKIAGHDVSYVHSPDGRLSSYYALDGDFHLVTNCRKLVERFYEAGAGKASLAASTDFQDCRDAMQLSAMTRFSSSCPPRSCRISRAHIIAWNSTVVCARLAKCEPSRWPDSPLRPNTNRPTRSMT